MKREIKIDGPARIIDHISNGYWIRHVIEPREVVIKRVRALRALGFTLREIRRADLVNQQWISPPGCSGEGRPYVHQACVRIGRRFVVTRQHGGHAQ